MEKGTKERLRDFIEHRLKDMVNESMFDGMLQENVTNMEVSSDDKKNISRSIDSLSNVIVEAIINQRNYVK